MSSINSNLIEIPQLKLKSKIHNRNISEISKMTSKAITLRIKSLISFPIKKTKIILKEDHVNCCTSKKTKRNVSLIKHNTFNRPITSFNSYNRTQQDSFFSKTPQYTAMAIKEKKLNDIKRFIKGKMIKLIQNSLIINKANINKMKLEYDYERQLKNQRTTLKKDNKSRVFKIQNQLTSDLNSLLTPNYRFEDCSYTPHRFLKEHFIDDEIKTIINDPQYFSLNKEPFKELNIDYQSSLKEKINHEEETKNSKSIIILSKLNKYFERKNQERRSRNQTPLLTTTYSCNPEPYTLTESNQLNKRHKQYNIFNHYSKTIINKDSWKNSIDHNNDKLQQIFSSFAYDKIFDTIIERKSEIQSINNLQIQRNKRTYLITKERNERKRKHDFDEVYYIHNLKETLRNNYLN